MTLLTVQQVKDYLRIETDAEDALIAALIVEAMATCEGICGTSFTHASVTWYDDAISLRLNEAPWNLLLQERAIDPATLVIYDCEDAVVDAAGYVIRQDEGLVKSKRGESFPFGPYRLTCVAGYDTRDDYTVRWLPIIQRLLTDFVAMLYQQRTPGALTEQASGTTVDYSQVDAEFNLPIRIAANLRLLRGVVYAR